MSPKRIDGRPRTPAGRRLYWVWAAMIQRCHNPKNAGYQCYGAKGITVCERWHSFDAFYADMGLPPTGGMLERKNSAIGYGPDNCCWATRLEQNRNRPSWCLTAELNGQTVSLRELWEAKAHPSLTYRNFRRRLRHRDWSLEEALTRPGRGSSELHGYRRPSAVA